MPSPKPIRERKPLLEPQNKDQNKRITAGWKPSHPGTGSWAGGRCRRAGSERSELGGQQAARLPTSPVAPLSLADMAMLVKKHLPAGKWQGPVLYHHSTRDLKKHQGLFLDHVQ